MKEKFVFHHDFNNSFPVSIVAAAKFSSDFFFKNSFYAKVGGISTPELNELELEFLFRTHFDLFVKKDTFCQYHAHLMMYSTNGTRIPRALRAKETPKPVESTKPKIETVCVPQRCKIQQFARTQDNTRDADINCGVISVPYNLRSGQNRLRCRQPFSRYQFPTQAQASHHHTSFHPSHRRHKSDQQRFHGNHPYAKRQRGTDGSNITITSEPNLGKPSVSVSMDIWFPMPSATTVAAR